MTDRSQLAPMDPRDVTRTLLYAQVDARCDNLATVVGQIQLTMLATVDGQRHCHRPDTVSLVVGLVVVAY